MCVCLIYLPSLAEAAVSYSCENIIARLAGAEGRGGREGGSRVVFIRVTVKYHSNSPPVKLLEISGGKKTAIEQEPSRKVLLNL